MLGQDAPFFEQVPAVLYETYRGVSNPTFDNYFNMLVDKYATSGGAGWAIYRENAKTAYRITVLPEGMESLLPIQQARVASFQEFDEGQMALWNGAWESRHVAVFNAAPAMSVVPEGFTVDDIRRLPYNRTTLYYLKWDQAAEFRQALRRRYELDREAGIENFVLTAWNGGIGTEAQVVMIRVSAESRTADAGPNFEARRAARASYSDEWRELNRVMGDAVRRIERHDQVRVNRLSYPRMDP
jgi:hypothetical protein